MVKNDERKQVPERKRTGEENRAGDLSKYGIGRRLWQYEKEYVRNCAIYYSVAAVLVLLYIGRLLVMGTGAVNETQDALYAESRLLATEAGLHTVELQTSMVCMLPGFLLLAAMGLRYGCGTGSAGSGDFLRTLPFTYRSLAVADVLAELGVFVAVSLLMWLGTVLICLCYGVPGEALDKLVVRINRECGLILLLTLQMYFWVKVVQTFFASRFVGMVAACIVYGAKYPLMLFLYGMETKFLAEFGERCEEFSAYGLIQQKNLEDGQIFFEIFCKYSIVLLVLAGVFVWRSRTDRGKV